MQWSIRRFYTCVLCFGGVILVFLVYHPRSPIYSSRFGIGADFSTGSTSHTCKPVPDLNNSHPKRNWYLCGGTEFPEKTPGPHKIFPEDDPGDRVLEQLMYLPDNYEGYNSTEKVILVYNDLGDWNNVKIKTGAFHGCPVNRCVLTDDKWRAVDADAIIFSDAFKHPGVYRPPNQLWMLYFLESPKHTKPLKYPELFNWTLTYRRDSTVVDPYRRWMYYNPKVRQKHQEMNYAANKTKKVAWFVSNCKAANKRLEYALELSKYITVDIFGYCGPFRCPRHDENACFELLERDYKFYLAFENSNCRDYITEKLYVNGLGHNVLPIVMGAHPLDYQYSAPEKSYIHVDEFSGPAELATYLHHLDKNDNAYNAYFRWKGTGEFISTYFWCRLCTMLHAPTQDKHYYNNVNTWWRGDGICTNKSWTTDGY